MKKFIILLILMLAPYAFAAPYFSGGGSGGGAAVLIYTVGTLPASPADGTVYAVTDGADAADCTVGSGTTLNLCMWDDGGSAYVIVGDGAGSGNAFSTHDAPAGTDPVATGADTLTWLDTAPVVITGDSGADSMTVSVNTATTSAEGVSEWATDAEAIALTADRVLVTSSIDNVLAEPPAIGGTTPAAVTATGFTIGSVGINEEELGIIDGGTVTTVELNILDGVTSTAAELNILDGVTSTAAELNILDGVTSSAAQLNYLDAADGETGSGSVVFDNTPSLITPDLGAATGTSLAVAGNVATSSGNVVAGTNDTTLGSFIVYGGGGSAAGGYIDLYNSADDDAAGVQDFWRIRAAATNLQIGIEGALTTSSAFILNADGSINKSATPKIVLDDTDGADGYIDLNAVDANSAVMTLGVDDASPADDVPYIEIDGENQTVEVKKPLTYRRQLKDCDLTSGDCAITGEECFGTIIDAFFSSDNGHDVDLSGCNCDTAGSKTNGPWVRVVQTSGDDSIEIYPGAVEYFRFIDGTTLDAGDEIDSPGTSYARANWIDLSCENATDQWIVTGIQGILSNGTIANDMDLHGHATAGYWQDGGSAD